MWLQWLHIQYLAFAFGILQYCSGYMVTSGYVLLQWLIFPKYEISGIFNVTVVTMVTCGYNGYISIIS